MARVLMSYFSDYGEAMYDAISSILRENGNDVFRFNTNCQFVEMSSWGGECEVIDSELEEKIKNFAPELIFNFNHSLPKNIYSILGESCKICIIDADNPETFWNKDLLKHNRDKYVYLGLQSYSKIMYEKFLGKQLKEDENYIFFPPATIVKSEKLKQDKNISFIGSNFYPLDIPNGDDFYSEQALKLYEEFKKDYFFPLEKTKLICKHCESPDWLHEKVRAYYVGQDRLKYMQVLSDLGFTFYGVRWWNRIAYYDFELAKCFDATPKVSIEENQWVYNTSKISVNISHPQAKSSFSWRVMDIMASNACLLMEPKPDWLKLFGKYLSQETLDSIIYFDRYDMREKAIRLIEDDALRVRCVADLNHAIAQNGRWEHRFKLLEEFLKIPLLALKAKSPVYIFIKRDDGNGKKKGFAFSIKRKSVWQNMRLYKRAKLLGYAVCLALAQIPLIDRLFKPKTKAKIFRSIQKYWN